MSKRIEVVAAAILDGRGRVLIARRPDHVHQGGKLEFPGGKREPGESPEQALSRELEEELGIRPSSSQALISLDYDYPDKSIHLAVYCVDGFAGEPQGCEGQEVEWREIQSLCPADFPAANGPILNALKLPESLLVTPDIAWTGEGASKALERVTALVDKHAPSLVLLRQPRWPEAIYQRLAGILAERYELQWQLKTSALKAGVLPSGAGLHLSSSELWDFEGRPTKVDEVGWFSAAVHNLSELTRAEALGVDFVVLGSVLETPTHSQGGVLGWQRAEALLRQAKMPVYLIGGLGLDDIEKARSIGAQGIAGIRCFSG